MLVKRIVDPGCALVHKGSGEPFGDGDKVIDVAVAVVRYLARKAHQPEPSFAAAAGALRARNASVYYGFLVKCDDEDQEAARRDRGRPEEGTVVQAARPRERDPGAPPSGNSTRERDALASPAAPAAP